MLFKLLVAADACKVRDEALARASFAAVRSDGCVLHVRVFAGAGGAPRVDIEALSSRQPVHSYFLRAPRNELEAFALATVALAFDSSILWDFLLMGFEQMAAEAARVRADAKALILPRLRALPRHVNSRLHRLVRVVELPSHHLLGSRRHAHLLH